MGLDPRIPLMVKTPGDLQEENLNAQMKQQQITAAQNENAMQPLKMESARNQISLEQLKMTRAKTEAALGLLGNATDQQSYTAARNQAIQQGLADPASTPEFYDPNWVKRSAYALLDAKDKIDIELKMADDKRQQAALGETARHNRAMEGIADRRLKGGTDPDTGQPLPDKNKFNFENTLRDEFNTLTKDFRTVQDAYSKISSTSNSGAGDMSMLYQYVKLLDPGSVVRESEFATAAASGSFGERVAGAVKSVASGGRLPASLRKEFLDEAKRVYEGQKQGYDRTVENYKGLAKRNSLNEQNIIPDYAQPATAVVVTKPTSQAIEYLKAHPQFAPQFEEKYGISAKNYLGMGQ